MKIEGSVDIFEKGKEANKKLINPYVTQVSFTYLIFTSALQGSCHFSQFYRSFVQIVGDRVNF